ncbi:MAG: spore cortex biosynthesis protein YabQ [Clostridiales bacterium]|jgi:spore cortex biosynthesis protein YabQ|nr:spore cortex biosynthesis protein YabQ [Clostridiales bacterium]MDR2751556.1 spore cortex biosynthesis protein YabQ [Clostridiales bacterium]
MILSMSQQALQFIWTVAIGAAAGVVFDFFRLIRKTFKHPDFLTQLEDFAYWLTVCVLAFYFILHKNGGEVRIYSIIGIFVGMGLYFATLSILVMKITTAAIELIKRVIVKTIQLLLIPVKLFIKLLGYPARGIKNTATNAAHGGKSLLRKTNSYAKMKAGRIARDLTIMRTKY